MQMSKGMRMPDTMTIVIRERDIPVLPNNVVYEPTPDLSSNYVFPIPTSNEESETASDDDD